MNDETLGLAPGELAFSELLRLGRLLAPERLPEAAAAAAEHIGGRDVEMLLVDHGQEVLVPSPPLNRRSGSTAVSRGAPSARSTFKRSRLPAASACGCRCWMAWIVSARSA
jgi:hypothetical protein